MMVTRDASPLPLIKRKAARRICGGEPRPGEMPSNRQVRDEVHALARRLLAEESPEQPADHAAMEPAETFDRFQLYERLLLPLEQVRQRPAAHPEGDALYHSLQVFELAREAAPYDEEFLLAALLHDVGKAIDPREPTAAALAALEGLITPRCAWLIENRPHAQALREGTLGLRARRRLEASADFDTLTLLAACDQRGRRIGEPVCDVHDALGYLRDLAAVCGE